MAGRSGEGGFPRAYVGAGRRRGASRRRPAWGEAGRRGCPSPRLFGVRLAVFALEGPAVTPCLLAGRPRLAGAGGPGGLEASPLPTLWTPRHAFKHAPGAARWPLPAPALASHQLGSSHLSAPRVWCACRLTLLSKFSTLVWCAGLHQHPASHVTGKLGLGEGQRRGPRSLSKWVLQSSNSSLQGARGWLKNQLLGPPWGVGLGSQHQLEARGAGGPPHHLLFSYGWIQVTAKPPLPAASGQRSS